MTDSTSTNPDIELTTDDLLRAILTEMRTLTALLTKAAPLLDSPALRWAANRRKAAQHG